MAGRSIVKRKPGLLNQAKDVVSDVTSGVGELKRQTGVAIQNVKAGVKKIKSFTK